MTRSSPEPQVPPVPEVVPSNASSPFPAIYGLGIGRVELLAIPAIALSFLALGVFFILPHHFGKFATLLGYALLFGGAKILLSYFSTVSMHRRLNGQRIVFTTKGIAFPAGIAGSNPFVAPYADFRKASLGRDPTGRFNKYSGCLIVPTAAGTAVIDLNFIKNDRWKLLARIEADASIAFSGSVRRRIDAVRGP